MELDLTTLSDDELNTLIKRVQQERRRRDYLPRARKRRKVKSQAQKDGRVGTAQARIGSTALVPGIMLYQKNDGYWNVRASAQVPQADGKKRQEIRQWALLEHGLKPAMMEAARWRHRYATSGFLTPGDMAGAALASAMADKELVRQLRSGGVQV